MEPRETQPPRLACFGKIPAYGDFVRLGAHGPVWRQVDTWMQEGLYRAKTQLGPAFASAYAGMKTLGFVFDVPMTGRTLSGVMHPSRDRVGRSFPLMITAEHGSDQALQPEGAFLEQAARIVRDAASGSLDRQALGAQIAEISPPMLTGISFVQPSVRFWPVGDASGVVLESSLPARDVFLNLLNPTDAHG